MNWISGRPALVAAGFFILLSVLSGCFSRKADISDRTIVKVNESSLLAKDFAELLAHRLKDFDAVSVKDQRVVSRIREQLINDFVIEIVTLDWATEKGIFVRREDLEAEVNSIRSYYPDDLAFRRALSEQSLTFDEWKEKLKFSMLQKLVRADLSKSVEKPKDAEVSEFYNDHKDQFQEPEQVKLRQIVLDSESNAKRIYQEVKKGRPLKELAAKFSIAPEAENGGDLGWIGKGTLDIFDAAFSMKVGQKSDVVKSPYGYHIFEVLGKKRAAVAPLKDVKQRIERQLQEQAEQKVYSSWLEERLRTSRVFRDQDLINSISVETKDE
ncbi:MAG: peptidyl-prolyl cis-trans isomerase [Bdellovibrionaceae bacterium]|nr:peptidyl-prolyl cis-trans isomerase [Bdellovibrionales bacterium]MCB9085439.1 peptidyl-prolyl cis-trans isomerase [Pseudobdellovibrionaceae bacterium]